METEDHDLTRPGLLLFVIPSEQMSCRRRCATTDLLNKFTTVPRVPDWQALTQCHHTLVLITTSHTRITVSNCSLE